MRACHSDGSVHIVFDEACTSFLFLTKRMWQLGGGTGNSQRTGWAVWSKQQVPLSRGDGVLGTALGRYLPN